MLFDKKIIETMYNERNVHKVQEYLEFNVLYKNGNSSPNIKDTSLYVRNFIDKEFHDVYFNDFVSSKLIKLKNPSLLNDIVRPIEAILFYESIQRSSKDITNKRKLYDLTTIHDNLCNDSWKDTLVKTGIENLIMRHIFKNTKDWTLFTEKESDIELHVRHDVFKDYKFKPYLFQSLDKKVEETSDFLFFNFLNNNVNLFKENILKTTKMTTGIFCESLKTTSLLHDRSNSIRNLS